MTFEKPVTDRRIRQHHDLDTLDFDDEGLLPVVVQDAHRGTVLMVAWASRGALERTLETGETHFWSRSRGELWHKGGTSGNTQRVVSLQADCDGDTVLARVVPSGPACHTGDPTCFGDSFPTTGTVLQHLWDTLVERAAEKPDRSYTARLLADENLRTKKLGEETAELIHALSRGEGERIVQEGADLLYHLLVALLGSGVSLDDLLTELDERRR
jgi:phosphoribosyl-ATP pyrophosphohydrolase/phosphoribosyl-AMP cyclohydrolase